MLLSARASGNFCRLSIEVAQVDVEPLEWLQKRWGGSIYTGQQRGSQRPFHRWQLRGRHAVGFLNDISLYVVRPVVQERIALALEYQAQVTTTWENRSPEYRQRQMQFVERMRMLNHRGLEQSVLNGRVR